MVSRIWLTGPERMGEIPILVSKSFFKFLAKWNMRSTDVDAKVNWSIFLQMLDIEFYCKYCIVYWCLHSIVTWPHFRRSLKLVIAKNLQNSSCLFCPKIAAMQGFIYIPLLYFYYAWHHRKFYHYCAWYHAYHFPLDPINWHWYYCNTIWHFYFAYGLPTCHGHILVTSFSSAVLSRRVDMPDVKSQLCYLLTRTSWPPARLHTVRIHFPGTF